MRWMRFGWMGSIFLLLGCETTECPPIGCPDGPYVEVDLVGEDGASALARGEWRGLDSESTWPQSSFDCSSLTVSNRCSQRIMAPGGADSMVEVRFELPDGTFTDWQSYPLDVTTERSTTECGCTSYEADPLRVVVPEAARLLPSSQGEGGGGPE